MSTTLRTLSGLMFVVLSGCAAFDKGRLDPRVASQVTVSRVDPPPGCQFLGEVKGYAPLGERDDAHVDVLRNAVLRGGNFVAVDLVERPVLIGLGSYVVYGRLFTCPLRGAPAPQAQALAARAPPPRRSRRPARLRARVQQRLHLPARRLPGGAAVAGGRRHQLRHGPAARGPSGKVYSKTITHTS